MDYCPPEHANALVERKLAKRCMKGFAIQLKNWAPTIRNRKLFLRIVIHGKSCQMGPRVTEDAADESAPGHELAKAAALAYLMIHAGSYCPLILQDG